MRSLQELTLKKCLRRLAVATTNVKILNLTAVVVTMILMIATMQRVIMARRARKSQNLRDVVIGAVRKNHTLKAVSHSKACWYFVSDSSIIYARIADP